MGQVLFSGKPTGTVGLGLFLIALSAFAFSAFDQLFWPYPVLSLAVGGVAALVLARRRSGPPHIDPRQPDVPD